MKKLFTFLFSLAAPVAFAQFSAPAIQWQKNLGGSGNDIATSVQQTSDGGYIVAARAASANGDIIGYHGGDNDFWVIKLDNTGVIQWQKCLGGTDDDDAYSIQQTTDGGYIVAGGSNSTDGDVTGNHGNVNADFWVAKLDNAGIIQWQKNLGGTGHDEAYSIQQTNDGGYIVAGRSSSTDGDIIGNHGSVDSWLVKLNDTGAIQWQKSLGGTNFDEAHSIQQTNDGGYIVAGRSSSTDGDVTGNHGSDDCWIVKLDNTGAIQWEKSLGGTSIDWGWDIKQTTDGGYVVVGFTGSTNGDVTGNHGGYDFWVVKLNNTGALQWQKSLGGSSTDDARAIQQTNDGGYIVAGRSSSTNGDVTGNHGSEDYWAVKLDNTGAMQWQKSLGGTNIDWGWDIKQTADGGYVVVGSSRSNDNDVNGNHGYGDCWIVKLAPDPTAVSTPIVAEGFSLFPNPATTEVRIQTSETIRSVLVTDISGKEVLRAGNTTVIPTPTLANGLYLVRITTDKGITTRKLSVQH